MEPRPSTSTALNQELSDAGSGLVGNDDVLRSVLAGCGDCIKILDLDGRLQFMSEGGKRVMEVDDFDALKGCPWPDLWEGAGNIDAKLAVAKAKAGGTGRFKGAANTAKGTPRYWDVQVSPIFGTDGQPSHLLSISRDITAEFRAVADLQEAMSRQSLLAGELQHRIKNMLAMISAIASQTMRGDTMKVAREAFTARLITLSHAHDILTQANWSSLSIKDVVDGALAPHRDRAKNDALYASGPDLDIQPKQALALSMALHELATNAIKYGALSANGHVDIVWSSETIGSTPTFRFRWVERGGPAVVEPTADKKGFGSRLIEKTLENDFAGKVVTSYLPTGLICELTAPLAALTEPEELTPAA